MAAVGRMPARQRSAPTGRALFADDSIQRHALNAQPARAPNRRPPHLRTGSDLGDARSPQQPSPRSRRRRRHSQEPRGRPGRSRSHSGARSLSPARTTLSQRRRSASVTKDDADLRRKQLPSIVIEPQPTGTPWRDLLAFAWTEALGDRHAFGLDDNVTAEIDNFLLVPFRFERFLWFGMLACLDTFLYAVTFLPIRAVVALYSLFTLALRMEPRSPGSPRVHLRAPAFSRAQAFDLARCVVIAAGVGVLRRVPLSRAYHWIRGQNTIKLYVIIGIMEVFDRLLCAFAQDALDSFYLSTRGALDSLANTRKSVIFLSLVLVVTVAHALLLFVHLTTLNVVVNANEATALFALLVSNNFSEIKSTVFKRFTPLTLFDITAADVCERFKLVLFLALLYVLGWAQVAGDATESRASLEVVRFQSLSVLGFEVGADWLKHAFVAKFNRVDASAYDAYAERVARDVVTGRRGPEAGGFALDHTQAVTRRLSFAVLPLACVAVRYAALSLGWLRLSLDLSAYAVAALAALGFLLLVQLKLLTSICLAGVAVGLCPDESVSVPGPLATPRKGGSQSFHDLPALKRQSLRAPDPKGN